MSAKKFAPFMSCVSPGFWQKLHEKLLDNEKSGGLTQQMGNVKAMGDQGLESRRIGDVNITELSTWGYYECTARPAVSQPCILSVDHTSFNENPAEYFMQYPARGKVVCVNSLDDYKSINKNDLIAENLFPIDNASTIINPSIIVNFIILLHADLKQYIFTYWFGFPTISSLLVEYEIPPLTSLEGLDCKEVSNIMDSGKDFIKESNGFFAINVKDKRLIHFHEVENGDGSVYCFVDPSGCEDIPGWPIRNLLALITYSQRLPGGSKLKIASIRHSKHSLCGEIRTFVYSIDFSSDWKSNLKVLGWEKCNDKFAPKISDLKTSLDPVALSESSVDFNLKLMKWRLFPDFDLEKMHKYKVCILGAGTLGCNVARCLMGWGVRNIQILDCGKVSYSNPVRQTLFNHMDCGEPKAITAAKNMKDIFPGVNAIGHQLFVPMPGHPPLQLEKSKEDFAKFEEIVKASDVLFLLTDTRESRWLPTVLGVVHNKLVMNAALGFDSYVVMRHGMQNEDLGCYFCTDIVVPGNSTVDRTLDQQCTVSRPGISMIAAALVVELMTSYLHSLNSTGGSSSRTENTLGEPPHTMRGFLSTGQFISPTFQKFDKCSACSKKVVDKFKEDGFDFVLDVMRDPNVLENVSGLDALRFGIDGIVELEDDEFSD